jgi:hypothetical protein
MMINVRIPGWRSLGLVFTGVVLGAALVAPVVARDRSATAVEPATIQTRMVSCAGSGFYPHADAAYDTAGTVRESEAHTTLRCAVSLPHRAVVSRVRFTLHDGSSSGVVGPCSLKRVGLTQATATTEQTLASVPATDLLDFSGVRRLTATSISFATIDNGRFAYWLECPVNSSPSQGIIGADVTYTIDSADG